MSAQILVEKIKESAAPLGPHGLSTTVSNQNIECGVSYKIVFDENSIFHMQSQSAETLNHQNHKISMDIIDIM